MTPHRRELLEEAIRRHRNLAEGDRRLASAAQCAAEANARERAITHDKQADALQAELDAA